MEVRIGVQQSARDVVLQMDTPADKLAAAITKTLKAGEVLSLVDVRGRTVLVQPDKVAYIEIGPEEERRVGFGTE